MCNVLFVVRKMPKKNQKGQRMHPIHYLILQSRLKASQKILKRKKMSQSLATKEKFPMKAAM